MNEVVPRNAVLIDESDTAKYQQYLTFVLRGETFAVSILAIKEIIQYDELTVVPLMPEFIRGVINLRGKVVPVVDLNSRFGRGMTNLARRTSIIIIEQTIDKDDDIQQIGIMVDAVNEVIEIANQNVEPTPEFGNQLRNDFIEGMAKHENRFIVILNINKVLSIYDMTEISARIVDEHEGKSRLSLEYASTPT